MRTRRLLTILHADDDVIAVDKPAGLAIIPGRGEATSLLEELAAQLCLPCRGCGDPRVRVVHRLDKETSGVVLFARNVGAQRHLSHQFQNNAVAKEYLALTRGTPAGDEGLIATNFGPHPTQKLKMAILKHGRPAVTRWQVETRFRRHTLVRCFPKTGKTHQIRVHLAHIGLPLVIDPIYNPPPASSGNPGVDKGLDPKTAGAGDGAIYLSQIKRGYRPTAGRAERPLIDRLTLHAHRLTLGHPDGHEITLTAELPKDFRSVLSQLHKC